MEPPPAEFETEIPASRKKKKALPSIVSSDKKSLYHYILYRYLSAIRINPFIKLDGSLLGKLASRLTIGYVQQFKLNYCYYPS